MSGRFQNKTVVVTGGASGIGEASVKEFAEEGAKVVISDMTEKGKALSDSLYADSIFYCLYYNIN
ncbi:hypothetical protein J32TS6_25990 [Virgibacillus pantothenticus]|nr:MULTISPECIES: SDR family NAD(P)-dependent oxidoreductase [Virgibacillus]API91239.1 hypothetical protein BKP57_04820 [Virgibacillus sp. 6R]MBS7429239.1 SDR family NAD(P)-dependent oxidoreductase [Virgibacillus sp. 19R1-5]MBU8568034.1 SDR family NAD(P)-dependent oxidoreductase [Virgibacillus pantothenticus]MBU8601710.1 SDR family NAD(P)-dependent oxidoreductase [Virgibacillus pantothenticus]MBU8636084.1 SDR family NAD(P)-dependent oxidoreductase [Virgibacillus pantothenticus]